MFTETLKSTLKSSGKNQKELAEYVGVKQNTVSDWINKGNSPKVDHIYRICEFLDISVEYLFNQTSTQNISLQNLDVLESFNTLSTQQQNIIKSTILEFESFNKELNKKFEPPLKVVQPKKDSSHEETDNKEYIYLKLYSQRASAGIGKYMYENDDFVEHKFELDYKAQKADHAIIVEGNSMYPTIENGDYIFIKEQSAIAHNEIGVFVYEDNVYCKRLNIDRKNKRLTLVSDNKDYDNIVIKDFENLRTIGKVIL